MINLEIDIKELDQALEKIINYPKQIEKSLYSAVNKTMNSARTVVSKQIRELSTLSSTKISDSISKPRVTFSNSEISGEINVNTTKSISLINYRLLPNKKITAQKGIQPSHWVSPKAQYKKTGSSHDFSQNSNNKSKSFIAVASNGNKGLFRRVRSSGQLLKEYGPRLQYFMQVEALQSAVVNSAKTNFLRYLRHEIEYRTGKLL